MFDYEVCLSVTLCGTEDQRLAGIERIRRAGLAFTATIGTGYCDPWDPEDNVTLAHWAPLDCPEDLQKFLRLAYEYGDFANQEEVFITVLAPGVCGAYCLPVALKDAWEAAFLEVQKLTCPTLVTLEYFQAGQDLLERLF
jgi:hypothetical protein